MVASKSLERGVGVHRDAGASAAGRELVVVFVLYRFVRTAPVYPVEFREAGPGKSPTYWPVVHDGPDVSRTDRDDLGNRHLGNSFCGSNGGGGCLSWRRARA